MQPRNTHIDNKHFPTATTQTFFAATEENNDAKKIKQQLKQVRNKLLHDEIKTILEQNNLNDKVQECLLKINARITELEFAIKNKLTVLDQDLSKEDKKQDFTFYKIMTGIALLGTICLAAGWRKIENNYNTQLKNEAAKRFDAVEAKQISVLNSGQNVPLKYSFFSSITSGWLDTASALISVSPVLLYSTSKSEQTKLSRYSKEKEALAFFKNYIESKFTKETQLDNPKLKS